MDIFSIFNKPAVPAQVAAPAAPAPASVPAPGTPGAPGATATPAPGDPLAFQAGKQGGESPMANFVDLWKIDPKDMPKDTVAALSPNFKIDPAAVAAAAKNIDYAKLISPEQMTKALGGDGATMAQILNAVTQAATVNAGMNTAKIVEAALAHQAQTFAEIMPAEVRKHTINQQLNQDHPIFSNPAAAPMLDGLKQQLTLKYPTASAAQISETAKSYLLDFIKTAGGSVPDPVQVALQQANQPKETNWEEFFK